MICNGILPIDQLRDHVPPISVVVKRISADTFEETYGIQLPRATVSGMRLLLIQGLVADLRDQAGVHGRVSLRSR